MTQLLVIEDEPIIRELLVTTLESAGYDLVYDLVTANDGEDGFNQAKANNPDLIITDMSLPKSTGWDLIAKIRGDAGIGHTPIIALTAHYTSEDRVAAYEAGVSGYEPKPVDIGKLL